MKNSIIFLIILSFMACKAQNSIQPRYHPESLYDDDVYYKDLNNDYNIFEGTWLYTNGNTSFKIVLLKKEMMHIQDEYSNYYIDALVGEYQYIENGVEKVNSLTNLSQDYALPYDYNIEGSTISKYGDPLCFDCDEENQIVIMGSLDEPNCEDGPMTSFRLRYFIENDIEKIEVLFSPNGAPFVSLDGGEPECTEYEVPYGEYIFVKQ